MNISKVILFILFYANLNPLFGQDESSATFHGVKIFVIDLNESKKFYRDILGFKVLSENDVEIKLETNQFPIYLHKAKNVIVRDQSKEAHVGLAVETKMLLPTIDWFRKLKINVHDNELMRNGVGIAIPFEDPSGNVIHLIEVQIGEVPFFEKLRIYNSGVSISNMTEAIKLYEEILGFEEWSRDYLPNALPLKHKDGSFAFMIHQNEILQTSSASYGNSPQIVLMLEVEDLFNFISYLKSQKIKTLNINGAITIRDNDGNYIQIVDRSK